MAIYFIGDLQGCFDPLLRLLDKVSFNSNDKLYLTGDLIARGTQSKEVLDFIISSKNIYSVIGNHDLHFLAVAHGIAKENIDDNFSALLKSKKLYDYVDYLRNLPFLIIDEKNNFCLSHAGIYPFWQIKQAKKSANELENLLKSTDYEAILQNMYNDKPDEFNDNLIGFSKYTFLINAFTRMRYLKKDTKKLNLKEKNFPPKIKNLQTWFDIRANNEFFNEQKKSNMKIIFGHFASLMGKTDLENFIGLDTGYIWGNHLTIYNLHDDKYFIEKNLNN